MTQDTSGSRLPRIVLSSFGTSGDINPLMALACRLRSAGYEPVLALQDVYRSKVERERLGFAPIRPDFPEILRTLGMNDERATSEMGGDDFTLVMRRMLLPHLEQTYADALEVMRDAALVIMGPAAWGIRLAAIKRRVPWLTVALQPSMFLESRRRNSEENLAAERQFRDREGIRLEPGTRLWDGMFSPFGTIALYSPLLNSDGVLVPPNTQTVGFAYYDRSPEGPYELAVPLRQFLEAGPPPLVFTTGTWLARMSRGFFEQSAAAARALKRRALLLTGVHGEGRLLAKDIFACAYAPFSQLFAHVDIVVHHGGAGTLSQALRAGRPQLVVPFGADQFDNAARLVRLGVARELRVRDYTARAAADELQGILSDKSYAERAAEVGKTIDAEDGAAETVRIVGDVLRAAV